MSETILKAEKIKKSYHLKKLEVPVLRGVDLEVKEGEWLSLLGASGSGKTTLLNILGALENADGGEVFFFEKNYRKLSSKRKATFRNEKIGFVFQAYHMLPELNVMENVLLPCGLGGKYGSEQKDKAAELLDAAGLAHRTKHRPNELSGGEQQRVAIARALINSPELVLADEPTGNLDSKTGEEILDLFVKIHNSKHASTIIMVTHDNSVAELGGRTVHLRDGKIE